MRVSRYSDVERESHSVCTCHDIYCQYEDDNFDYESDHDDGSDYVYQSDSDEEPYEYDSDDSVVYHEEEYTPVCNDELYQEWLKTIWEERYARLRSVDPQSEVLLLIEPVEISRHEEDHQHYTAKLEHIAGPECMDPSGYNGHRLGVEEMKGCRTVQCLIWKDEHWKSEPDDQDFETHGKHCLSGLTDSLDTDGRRSPLRPGRHGMTTIGEVNGAGEVSQS